MLAPAGRLVGSVPAFRVNALLDMLNCAIWMGDAPGFVIDTVRNTGVPIVTSPKSIVDGLSES